jgi:hypothetical protein
VWGANARGQLGCGDRTDRAVPTLVEDDVLYNTHLALDAPADGNRKSFHRDEQCPPWLVRQTKPRFSDATTRHAA